MNQHKNYREMAVEMGKSLYPNLPWRLVRSPEGYYAHYHAKAHIASTLDAFTQGLMDERDGVMGGVVGICLALRKFMYPTYYVGADFIEAMYRSKLPSLKPTEFKMPFPAMIIGLPTQFSLNVFKCHVPYLYIARLGVGVDRLGASDVTNNTPKFGVNAVVYNGHGVEEPVNYYAGALDDEDVSTFDSDEVPFTVVHGEELPDDRKITQLIMAIAVKCIMAASARPDLVESQEVIIQQHKVKKGKIKPELWSPRWIGRNYKIKHAGPGLGGTHASPTAHWRAGHIRQQPYGPQRALRKTIWMEPVLVNAS